MLALHVAIHRWDPHRQSRRGRSLASRCSSRRPTAISSPQHQRRHRALAQADLRSRPVLLRVRRAGRRQEPRHCGRQRRRPRHPRLRPGTRSRDRRAPVALVCRTAEEGRSRVGDVAERRGREHGGGMTWQPVTYDPDLNLIFVYDRNPQPVIAHAIVPGDNLSPRRSSRSMPTPGRWRGTSSRRRTIRTTGTRPRRRCCSTARSTASRASSSRRRPGTATSSCSIGPTARHRVVRVREDELVLGYDEKGQPIPNPAKIRRSTARSSRRPGRRAELATSELQPADRSVLRAGHAGLQRLLPLRSLRESAGMGRHRPRRVVRVDGPGGRLQDGQDEVEPQVGRRARSGS